MLRKLTELSPEGGVRLMAVYRESNVENAAWFAPNAPTPEEGLRQALAAELARTDGACIRSCVSKKNRPSLALHQKVGFTVERDPDWDFGTGEEDAGSFGMLRRIP